MSVHPSRSARAMVNLRALKSAAISLGAMLLVLVAATPGIAKAPSGSSLLTPKSVKCLGPVWNQVAYARCKPQLTVAAIQKFATAVGPGYVPPPSTSTQDVSTPDRIGEVWTQTFRHEFVSVSSCHRGFPRPLESGCSLITREFYKMEHSGYTETCPTCGYSKSVPPSVVTDSCNIESRTALSVGLAPSWREAVRAFADEAPNSVIRIRKPFAVVVTATSPNPDPPPASPC